METARQISAWLVNKPGRMAAICAALAKEKIDIGGLAIMGGSQERSVMRFVPDDAARTRRVLDAMNTPYDETDVLLVPLDHKTGSLSRVCERLAAGSINIDYCYVSAGQKNGRTVGIFKVSNLAKAQRLLAEGGGAKFRTATRRPLHARR